MKKVVTFGTFDVFHYGHLRLLQRAAKLGSELVVGVSSDAFSFRKKGRYPVYAEHERMEIVASLRFVDDVFLEEAMELKRQYITKYRADCLVMGDDWVGRFDEFGDICHVTYLTRTPDISTTQIIDQMRNLAAS